MHPIVGSRACRTGRESDGPAHRLAGIAAPCLAANALALPQAPRRSPFAGPGVAPAQVLGVAALGAGRGAANVGDAIGRQ